MGDGMMVIMTDECYGVCHDWCGLTNNHDASMDAATKEYAIRGVQKFKQLVVYTSDKLLRG